MSTPESALRRVIESHIRQPWSNRAPMQFENETFAKPKGKPWCRLTIRVAEGEQATINDNPRHDFDGVVIVQMFVPEGTGTDELLDLCGQMAAILRADDNQALQLVDAEAGQITFGSPTTRTVGPFGAWHQANVSVSFVQEVHYPIS